MNFPILLFVGLILLILGIVFLFTFSLIKKHFDKLYKSCTETTIGIVDKVVSKYGSNDLKDVSTYYPVYKYNVSGIDYFCLGNKGAYRKKDVNTENTIIYYNPINPKESYMNRKTNDIIIKVFKVLGIIFSIVSFILIILNFILAR